MSHNSPQPAVRPPHPLALALIERMRERPGALILEIGAGSGRNTAALKRAGFAVVEFESAQSACAAALSTHAMLHGRMDEIEARLARIAGLLDAGAPFYATFGSASDARFGTGVSIAPNVYAPETGDEAGVAHAYFTRDALCALLERHFTVVGLEERGVDEIAGAWAHERQPLRDAVHWFVRAERR
jgi:hypothetical protein